MKEYEEGMACELCAEGQLQWQSIHSDRSCSCHISPPCSTCTDQELACDKCGEVFLEYEPPSITTSTSSQNLWLTTGKTAKERFDELPDGVFGSARYPNDGWGMAIKGKMPESMTREEVLKACGICAYGIPLFKQFGDGTFLLTYNYD